MTGTGEAKSRKQRTISGTVAAQKTEGSNNNNKNNCVWLDEE